MTAKICAFIIIGVCLFILMRTSWVWRLQQTRRKAGHPPPGKPTLFDVKDSLLKGEKEVAIRLYCQIFKTNRFEALKAVEELEKSLRP